MSDAAEAVPNALALPTIKRPVYIITVPEAVREFGGDPKELKMVPLSAGEDKQANDMAGAQVTGASLTTLLVKMSVTHVDGRTLTWADTSKDDWWDKCGAKMRLFVMRCYRTVNEVPEEQMASFFAPGSTALVYKVQLPA